MSKALCLLTACLMLGVTAQSGAQETSADKGDLDDRLDSLKAELLDVTPGYYVSPLLSASVLTGELEQNGVSLDFDGYLARAGAAVGYQVNPLRVELAATVGRAEIEIDVGDQTEDASITTYEAVLNTYYDLPVDLGAYVSASLPMITPYVGAGVGWVYLDSDDSEGDDGVIAQGTAGLGVRLSPHWTLDTGYRYFYLPRIEADGVDNESDSHSAEIKVRYRF